jgi:ABC-2 type transport system ATP-binding protein
MAPVTIEARHLTKRYAGRIAVDDLSFTAHAGEVIGLLGPNGAGKTTTVRLLTTVVPATSGSFTVAGVTSPAEVRRHVGALPESAGYPGHLTGGAYLRRHARLFGLSRAASDDVATTLLADVGLQERGSTPIRTYSRGMRQRLGIARALVHDPTVVFLDEPTLGLDPAGQRQVLDLVRSIAERRQATVVLSTHTLPDVEAVCSSVLILNRGRVVASGSVHDVIRAASAPRRVRMRVPADLVGAATTALLAVRGTAIEPVEADPGGLVLHLPVDTEADAALRVLLDSGVPVLSFELEGARLSDAFLAMTEDPAP